MPVMSVSFAEGTESVNPVFTVSLDVASATPISVNYRTIPGTAIEGVDFRRSQAT